MQASFCCNHHQVIHVAYPVTRAQLTAATAVGVVYLLALVLSMFAEFYVPGQLIDYGDASATAQNIIGHERLFRLGAAANLLVFALDVVLIGALYMVLEPVSRHLALVAVLFRAVETTVLVVVVLNDFAVLRILSGAGHLQAFEPQRLHALARLAISGHNDAYRMGLLFFGLGSSVFGYLWLKSRYIPRLLAAVGLLGSVLIALVMFAFVIFPELSRVVTVAVYAAPIFVFELAIGVWLLVRGLQPGREESARLLGA